MAKYEWVAGFRQGKVGHEKYFLKNKDNFVQEARKYVPVNSQWILKEEFKEYILSLFDKAIPQIYVLPELPEDLYDYALLFIQTENSCQVYLDKEGVRTQINLSGGDEYDAVDVVQELPQNPRNNVIYIKQDNADTNDPPVYTMYVSENDTLTKIDLGSIEIKGFLPIVVNENNTISLNYSTDHFVLQQGKLTAGPLETQIASKQDKLVSGSNIRTVGGNNLVAANLMNQDIGPSDIMSLAEPLKWDSNDPYKVKLGYNTNDFELDSNDDLKLKGIDVPVTGAVSPLYLDSNKKVNLGITSGNGLKVANNNLQMTVSAPLFQSTGNNLNFRYSTTDFSVTSNTFTATPLKTSIASDLTTLSNAINANTTAINRTTNDKKIRFVGCAIFEVDPTRGVITNQYMIQGLSLAAYGSDAPSTFLVRGFGTIPYNERFVMLNSWNTNNQAVVAYSTSSTQFQIVCSAIGIYSLLILAKY